MKSDHAGNPINGSLLPQVWRQRTAPHLPTTARILTRRDGSHFALTAVIAWRYRSVMACSHSTRLKAGLSLIFLFALSSHLRLFLREVRVYPWYDRAIIERNEVRYTPLRSRLSRGEIIGYTSDVDPGLSIAGASGLYLAQHALVPAVVDRSTLHPLVVGNF